MHIIFRKTVISKKEQVKNLKNDDDSKMSLTNTYINSNVKKSIQYIMILIEKANVK